MSTDIKSNNATLDPASPQQDGAALQQDKTKKRILFAKRSCSGAAGSSEALLKIIPDSRPRRASFFALLCDFAGEIRVIITIMGTGKHPVPRSIATQPKPSKLAVTPTALNSKAQRRAAHAGLLIIHITEPQRGSTNNPQNTHKIYPFPSNYR